MEAAELLAEADSSSVLLTALKVLDSDKRSKAACARCRSRKTKCSGDNPCSSCLITRSECIYPRRPKKIKVLDIEYEELVEKIKFLEQELELERKTQTTVAETLNLSVFLSSPSSELVSWNLIHFMNDTVNFDGMMISPDFNSFLEENIYDGALFSDTPSGPETVFRQVQSLTFQQVKKAMDTVVKFINIGYLTINPVEFEESLTRHFDHNGQLKEPNNDLFFNLKILMVMAFGDVYHERNAIGYDSPPVNTPGFDYFNIVIRNLPSNFQMMNFSRKNMRAILDIIELYGLVSLYSRILDKKSASCFYSLIALKLCISINLHKDSILTKSSENLNLSKNFNSSNVFWSTYCLNRFSCVRTGDPLLLSFKDISLPYTNTKIEEELFFDTKIFMKFYIELARISETINQKVYNTTYNPKDYLTTIFNILSLLQDWTNSIPDFLKIDLTKESKTFRTLSSLHLNYLHHVHLTCIPIFLNFAKFKISKFKSSGVLNTLKLKNLPKNIENLVIYAIQSAQTTVSIFSNLIEYKLLRAFGFTDCDFIYATAMLSLICLVLNFSKEEIPAQNFITNLNVCVNLLKMMEDTGNKVAGSKKSQILKAIDALTPIFDKIDVQLCFKDPEVTNFIEPDAINDQVEHEYFTINADDLNFMEALLNDYDNILN